MPRMNRKKYSNEKSKDFMGSMKRLLSNLKPWRIIMIVALMLAMISSILTLIAPNKLKDLTDIMTEGIKPDIGKIQDISTSMLENLSLEKITPKMDKIMNSKEISTEDKMLCNDILKNINNKDNKLQEFVQIPESILNILLEEITIEDKKITVKDQIELLNLYAKTPKDLNTKEAINILSKFPTSVYEIVKPKIDMTKIKNISLLLLCIYLISTIFSYIESYATTTASNNFAKSLRTKITKKINSLPLNYFDTHENGDILSRVTNDVSIIAQNLNDSLATLVSATTLLIGSIIMMFTTNWIMAITAIVTSLLGLSIVFVLLKKSQKYFLRKQTELGDLNGYIEEMYDAHNVIKVYNAKEEVIDKFDKLNSKLYVSNKKSQFLSGLMQPVMAFIGNFGYVCVCIVGALLTMNGYISFGVIVAFIMYIRLFTNPLSQIAQAMTSLQITAAASERVYEFLDEKELTNEKELNGFLDKDKVKGKIEFKNVKFGYNKERTIIKNFNLKATPGQKIAIVGPTGAGKTTLVNLLMKFYEINSGDILIDDESIKNLTRENIHQLFIMVLQDTWLFNGTIKENICFNKENVTDDEIWKALETVGIDHFVKTLPGNINYEIDNSDTISQGQKQLLTIARGMIEDAPFLILDEATSNVDTRTEELVQKAMDKLMVGRTSFIIAHRLSTIKNADLILVMKDGDIIEQGTHEELIEKNGFYSELYNSQFEL